MTRNDFWLSVFKEVFVEESKNTTQRVLSHHEWQVRERLFPYDSEEGSRFCEAEGKAAMQRWSDAAKDATEKADMAVCCVEKHIDKPWTPD